MKYLLQAHARQPVFKLFSFWLLAAFIFGPCGEVLSAQSSNSDQSIEDLLRKSQEAILKSSESQQSADKELSQKREPKVKARAKNEVTPEAPRPHLALSDGSSAASDAPPIKPIDTKAIEQVISVDLKASQREREPIYPLLKIGLAGQLQSLSPVYTLMKDDDHFTDDTGGQLKGLSLTFSPTWKISALETEVLRTFVSAVLQVGFAEGTVSMRRTGIHPSKSDYSVKIFPANVGIQADAELWKKYTVFVGYGPGLEVFHQDGIGVNDTISQIFYGDEGWLGLSASLSRSTQFIFSYKRKGLNLLVRSPNYGGNIFSAGFVFAILG